MKNLAKILITISLIIFTINYTNAQHEEVDNILIENSEGIRFYIDDGAENLTDTSKIKCHPEGLHSGMIHPVFLEFRPSYQSSYNRVVIYQSGLMGIGVEDPCLKYQSDILQFDSSDVKLLLQTGKALRVDGSSEWDIPSDMRLKKDVIKFKDGLDVINQINPISYKYNGRGGTSNNKKAIGISAQEMEKIAPYTVRKSPSTQGAYRTFNGSSLRYVMINAIKELDKEKKLLKDKLTAQQEEINDLKKTIVNINDRLDKYFSNDVNANSLSRELLNSKGNIISTMNDLLQQNTPNPFNGETEISYSLLNEAQNAQLVFFNVAGNAVKTIDLDTNMKSGTINLNFEKFGVQKGTYFYSLFIDGRLISTKKMLFIN